MSSVRQKATMGGVRGAFALLALVLACAGGEDKDGLTKATEACDLACTDPAQGGSLQYEGGLLCGARWTCRCALPGEPEASVCDPIVRVGVIGDTRLAGDATDPAVVFAGEAVGLMTAWRPHVLAHAGDIAVPQAYATHLDTLLAVYGMVGVPRLLAVGETDVNGATSVDVIRNAFPTGASSWLEPGQLYGSFDLRGVHFVALDATYLDVEPAKHFGLGSGTYNRNGYLPKAERDWLAADLAATKLPTVIVLHPGTGVWNTDDPSTRLDNAPEVMAILEAHRGKIAAVVSAHTHIPLHATVNGIHYFTVEALAGERAVITPHDRGVHSQLEIDTELHELLYTVWENDAAKGYLEVQRLELPF